MLCDCGPGKGVNVSSLFECGFWPQSPVSVNVRSVVHSTRGIERCVADSGKPARPYLQSLTRDFPNRPLQLAVRDVNEVR